MDDHVLIGLDDSGILTFEVQIGTNNPTSVKSRTSLFGESHKAVLEVFPKNITMKIDDNPNSIISNSFSGLSEGEFLNVYEVYGTLLYIGGHPSNIGRLTKNQFNKKFNGCITTLGIVHERLPGKSGGKRFGDPDIKFNGSAVRNLVNVKCVTACEI